MTKINKSSRVVHSLMPSYRFLNIVFVISKISNNYPVVSKMNFPKNNFSTSFLVLLAAVCLVTGAEQEYQRISRQRHNDRRSKHCVNKLEASADLNNRAVWCAQYYARKGKIDHSCPHKNGAGENLWAQFGGRASDNDVAFNSESSWYEEESQHDYSKDYQRGTGHFTQMIWKDSRQLGFGVGRSGDGKMIVGCALYSPPGNYLGTFKNNVKRPCGIFTPAYNFFRRLITGRND